MKHVAFFLCMVIGYVCVDSQRVEKNEDDSKADQDGWKAASLDADETITEDQAISSKGVLASAQSSECTSNETEDCEKLSSAAKSMNVTSEVKKSEQRAHLGRRVSDVLSLLNRDSHRNISANQHPIGDNRSLARTSAPQRDTSLTSRVMFGWSYRTESRGALAHGNVTNGTTIEGWEDLDNVYGIITLMVKGYVEAPATVEYRLIHSYVEHFCQSAESFLGNSASGYWKEVVRLRNRHAAPLETSAVLKKYWELSFMEFEANSRSVDETTRELHEYIHSIQNGYEDGETVERVVTWFECPNKAVETRLQIWDMAGIVQMFADFLCMVIGFIGIIIFLIIIRWRIKTKMNKFNEMYNMKKISPREEHI